MMTPFDESITGFRRKLQKKLDPGRYEHSLSVSFTCMALAMNYGYDIKRAEIAGILHDCAKHFTDEDLIVKCRAKGVALSQAEIDAPAVIHAKYGAWLAEHKYGIEDPEILSAIACHTTGKAGMGTLDKILYIADYIEPRRNRAPDLPRIRKLAFHDLDQTMYEILKGTLEYLNGKGANVDPATMDAYQFFENMREEKNSDKSNSPESNSDKSNISEPDNECTDIKTQVSASENLTCDTPDHKTSVDNSSGNNRYRPVTKTKRARKWKLQRK